MPRLRPSRSEIFASDNSNAGFICSANTGLAEEVPIGPDAAAGSTGGEGEKCRRDGGKVEAPAPQIVPGSVDWDELRWLRDQVDRRAQFVDRAKGILCALDEQRRHPQAREVLGAQPRGLAGRVQRIGEQQ